MGINAIDENLVKIISNMGTLTSSHISDATTMARALGQVLCLFVAGSECWQVMMGKKSFDFLKIARPCALGFVIFFWAAYVSAISGPGLAFANYAKIMCDAQNDKVKTWEKNNYTAAIKLNEAIKTKQAAAKMAENTTKDKGLLQEVVDAGTDLLNNIKSQMLSWMTINEVWLNNKLQDGIKWVGEICWQVSYYGILLCGQIFLGVLAIFGPISFALSVVSPWHDAWSQWTSRYVSITLYPSITYLVIVYVDQIFLYALQMDYKTITAAASSEEMFAAYTNSSLGTTCCYVVACFIGCLAIRWVPELASWCMPAHAAQSATGVVTGMQSVATRAATAGVKAII